MTLAQSHMPVLSQHESKLLSAPTEIRRLIYGYIIPCEGHAFYSRGKIHLSLCLRPNLGDELHDSREPCSFGEGWEALWGRRLQSSWGQHWECEEVAFAKNADLHEQSRNQTKDPLLICKKMSLDVYDFMAELKVINVTNLTDAEVLFLRDDELDSGLDHPWNLWNYILPRIKTLNLALRLPLPFYKFLEEYQFTAISADHLTKEASTMYTTWLNLWPAICQLQQLESLHIWLDHDETSSWSIVNERLALCSVATILTTHLKARSEKRTIPQMNIVSNLPKLHPRKTEPETHFVQESILLPLQIQRRIRQRRHCEVGPCGELSVKHIPDFPVLHWLPEYFEETEKWAGRSPTPTMTMQEVEQFEIGLWDEGKSIEQFTMELDGMNACY